MIRPTTRTPPTMSSAKSAAPARCARLIPASVIQEWSVRTWARERSPSGGEAARSLSINLSAHEAPKSGDGYDFIVAGIRRMAVGCQEKPLAGGDLGVCGNLLPHRPGAPEPEAREWWQRVGRLVLRHRRHGQRCRDADQVPEAEGGRL